MLPPPCLTVGSEFWGFKASSEETSDHFGQTAQTLYVTLLFFRQERFPLTYRTASGPTWTANQPTTWTSPRCPSTGPRSSWTPSAAWVRWRAGPGPLRGATATRGPCLTQGPRPPPPHRWASPRCFPPPRARRFPPAPPFLWSPCRRRPGTGGSLLTPCCWRTTAPTSPEGEEVNGSSPYGSLFMLNNNTCMQTYTHENTMFDT